MTNGNRIDLDNFPIIEASDVPKTSARNTPYREMLKRIKKGKAMVIDPKATNLRITTVRAAIRRLQKKGEFKQLEISQRTMNGKQILYIINPSDETEKF